MQLCSGFFITLFRLCFVYCISFKFRFFDYKFKYLSMLISVYEASQRLNVSIRMVQIRCKNSNVKKIGNKYLITNEIIDTWIKVDESRNVTKYETNKNNTQISLPKQNKTRFAISQIITLVLFCFLVIILYLFYDNLKAEISYLKNENIKDSKIYKDELKMINKRLNDANDVINTQQLEIQYLKIKDSINSKPKF